MVGLDGMGYLLGPTLRAPYGANNASWRKGLLLDLNDGSLPFHRLTNGWLPLKNHRVQWLPDQKPSQNHRAQWLPD